MKSEELFIVLAAWFLGTLAAGMDALFWKVFGDGFSGWTMYKIFAFVFWGFSIYFLLKYTGLICRRKKK